MVAAFLALTHSIERWPSTSSSQTKESVGCCGGAGCCAAIVTRVREEIASRERRPTAARYLRFFMRPPCETIRTSVLSCGYLFPLCKPQVGAQARGAHRLGKFGGVRIGTLPWS